MEIKRQTPLERLHGWQLYHLRDAVLKAAEKGIVLQTTDVEAIAETLDLLNETYSRKPLPDLEERS